MVYNIASNPAVPICIVVWCWHISEVVGMMMYSHYNRANHNEHNARDTYAIIDIIDGSWSTRHSSYAPVWRVLRRCYQQRILHMWGLNINNMSVYHYITEYASCVFMSISKYECGELRAWSIGNITHMWLWCWHHMMWVHRCDHRDWVASSMIMSKTSFVSVCRISSINAMQPFASIRHCGSQGWCGVNN